METFRLLVFTTLWTAIWAAPAVALVSLAMGQFTTPGR
jgi:hypothetical protein